jgi:hypothetical protein
MSTGKTLRIAAVAATALCSIHCAEAPESTPNVTVISPGDSRQSSRDRPPDGPRPKAGWVTDTIKALTKRDAAAADYVPLTFSVLSSYPYPDPDMPMDLAQSQQFSSLGALGSMGTTGGKPTIRPEIPTSIRRLSGKRVGIEGFMMPLDYDNGTLSEFVLNGSYDMCAFGVPSSLNEWILVKMDGGKRTRFTGHIPVSVFGTLQVGEEMRDGRVVSIYRLTADFLGVDEELVR